MGGIAGGYFAERIVRKMGPGPAAQWTTLASAAGFAAIPVAPNGYILGLVLALFEFSGLIWNTVSVSYRQRTIPDELLGRVNSVYRLLAWGMMPIGLLLSGIIVSATAEFMPRDVALTMPFVAAAGGAALLAILAWKPLGVGFAVVRCDG